MFSIDDWSFEEALDGYTIWSHYSQQRTVTQFSAHSHWRPWTFWLCPTCLLRLLKCITKTSSRRSFPGLPQPSSSPPSNYAGRTVPATNGETIKQLCLFIHFWEFVSYQLMAALTFAVALFHGGNVVGLSRFGRLRGFLGYDPHRITDGSICVGWAGGVSPLAI